MNELEALQNHVNSIRFEGLTLHEKVQQDKRVGKKYYLNIGQYSISPCLYYEQMNHFLLGFNKALAQKSENKREFYRVITPDSFINIDRDTIEEARAELKHFGSHPQNEHYEYWQNKMKQCKLVKVTEFIEPIN